jgi:hypothetical protein
MPTHALSDATDLDISPLNSIAYARAVSDRMGDTAARDVLRPFLIPGRVVASHTDANPTSVLIRDQEFENFR